jgi:hypothetical protein
VVGFASHAERVRAYMQLLGSMATWRR